MLQPEVLRPRVRTPVLAALVTMACVVASIVVSRPFVERMAPAPSPFAYGGRIADIDYGDITLSSDSTWTIDGRTFRGEASANYLVGDGPWATVAPGPLSGAVSVRLAP